MRPTLTGLRAEVRGEGPLAAATIRALRGAGASLEGPPELVVLAFGFEGSREAVAAEAFGLVTAAEQGARYVVGLLPAGHALPRELGRALATTLCTYASARSAAAINLLGLASDGPGVEARAADAVVALASGLLDAVRGQLLLIGES